MSRLLHALLVDPIRAFGRQRLLAWTTAGFVAAVALLYGLPGLASWRAPFAEWYATPILRAMILVALAPGIGRLRSPAERRFWSLLVVGFGAWFLSDLVFLAPEQGPFFWSILEGIGYLTFWPIFVLALGQAPEKHLRVLSWRGTRWVPTAAFLFTGTVVAAYAMGLPIGLDPERFLGGLPSYQVFVALDLMVGSLLAIRAFQSTGRWRRLYAMLAATLWVWTATDVLGGFWVAGVLDMPYGAYWDLLWFAPYLLVVFTAAMRDATATGEDPGPVMESGPRGADAIPAVALAAVLPIVHAITRMVDSFPGYSPWQELLAVGGLLGNLALAGLVVFLVRRHQDDAVHVVVLDDAFQETQKMEALGRLSGGIAHDFNNLLLLVQGHVELMADRLRELPEGPEFVDGMRRAVERGNGLTRQLLAFGRQPGGNLHTVDANEIIQETRSLLERSLGAHIQLRTDLAEDLWPVGVEPGQLSQILINLSLNARNAMPDGGRLTLRTRNLRVEDAESATPTASLVEIEVADTGVGMDEATRRRIFEPFFTTRTGTGGTGLGLSVVYGIVHQAGGEVRCHSAAGAGTTFRILLPRVAEVATTPIPDLPSGELPRRRGVVLLVEDQADVREVTRRYLERLGYEVLAADDGVEAWDLARRHPPVTAVLTDVVMPRMGGVELARRLRSHWPAVPVVFVSGYSQDPQTVDDLRQLGSCTLQKPYSLSALADALDEAGPASESKASAEGA